MKTQFTFGEVAKIFAQVEKVSNCVKNYEEKEAANRIIDQQFDAEFEKAGFTFRNAPEVLHELFANKLSADKDLCKATRNAYNSVKEFGKLIEIGTGYMEYTEEKVVNFLKNKWYNELPTVASRVKTLAMKASTYINY